MNEFVSPRVNYVNIIDALLNVSRDRINRWGKPMGSTNDAWYVQDARTVGLMVGRQCGASDGALSWMGRHPYECILITKDAHLRDAHKLNYSKINGRSADEYLSLVPCIHDTINVWNTRHITDEIKERVRYVIVDDAMFTVGVSYLKRSDFNKWVAETFHPDTFVILIK